MDDPPLIVRVIQKYHPDWLPPRDLGRRLWVKTLCPFHGESNPSATISQEYNAFRCWACPVKGDAVGIIKLQEGVNHSEALRIAETVSPGSYVPIPRKPPRVRSREVPWDTGAGDSGRRRAGVDKPVPPGLRGRSTPWS